MPRFIVSVEKGLNESQYAEASKHVTDQGGKVVDTFKRDGVAPGFLVDFPENAVGTLQNGPNIVGVEQDQDVKTQI